MAGGCSRRQRPWQLWQGTDRAGRVGSWTAAWHCLASWQGLTRATATCFRTKSRNACFAWTGILSGVLYSPCGRTTVHRRRWQSLTQGAVPRCALAGRGAEAQTAGQATGAPRIAAPVPAVLPSSRPRPMSPSHPPAPTWKMNRSRMALLEGQMMTLPRDAWRRTSACVGPKPQRG